MPIILRSRLKKKTAAEKNAKMYKVKYQSESPKLFRFAVAFMHRNALIDKLAFVTLYHATITARRQSISDQRVLCGQYCSPNQTKVFEGKEKRVRSFNNQQVAEVRSSGTNAQTFQVKNITWIIMIHAAHASKRAPA